jgi:multicomponent Na+:H+ antiporter subunit E
MIVARSSGDLLFSKERVERKHFYQFGRFCRYLPWLFYQILLANIYVMKLALHPDMPQLIDPHVIRFKTNLKGDLPLTTFANSITLTPGTITLLIQEGYFYVHSISQKVADDLLTGEMEQKVSEIHREN